MAQATADQPDEAPVLFGLVVVVEGSVPVVAGGPVLGGVGGTMTGGDGLGGGSEGTTSGGGVTISGLGDVVGIDVVVVGSIGCAAVWAGNAVVVGVSSTDDGVGGIVDEAGGASATGADLT